MKQALADVERAAETDPRIKSVTSLYEGAIPQYKLTVDRNRIKMQQLEVSDVFSSLSAYMGGSYINDFTDFGRVYQVNLAWR